MKFYRILALVFSTLIFLQISSAQQVGDTIKVTVFDYNSQNRDTTVNFPDPSLSFEKIILKYNMRCKGNRISTGTDRNLGCGEWDYSCNTYVIDSNKVEAIPSTVESHSITDFSGTEFGYLENQAYDYYCSMQDIAEFVSANSETTYGLNILEDQTMGLAVATDKNQSHSRFVYTSSELSASGMDAGSIDAISLYSTGTASSSDFLKISIKSTSSETLTDELDYNNFSEVFYGSVDFVADGETKIYFTSPFNWDGQSNLIISFDHSASNEGITDATILKSGEGQENQGLIGTSENHFRFIDDSYIETDDYKGISNATNRTIEAWIRTSTTRDAEICSWGTNEANRKWVFRMNGAGRLRVENAAGGTVGTQNIADGEWHHIAAVLRGTNLANIKFYIDGVLDPNSEVGNASIITNTTDGDNLRISRGVNDRYLRASLDEIRIWSTDVDPAEIATWMGTQVNDAHPDYDNLELYYNFNGASNGVVSDLSVHERDATVIGQDLRSDLSSAPRIVKGLALTSMRPLIGLHRGDYVFNRSQEEVNRPVAKAPHYVVSRSINLTSPDFAISDEIVETNPQAYWSSTTKYFNESDFSLKSESVDSEDGKIVISDLSYTRRFPWFVELVSFVTPYGIGIDLGPTGVSWYFDMTDYTHLLRDPSRIVMGLGGQWQEEMDLEFLFIVGTPPRDVLNLDQPWQGTIRSGSPNIGSLRAETRFSKKSYHFPENANFVKLKSTITGHGSEGEFHQNGGIISHEIDINDFETFNWIITENCSLNPISPQGGTWAIWRQGWCPGQRSLLKENDLSWALEEGDSLDIDYRISAPANPSGDYRYHIAHQLVSYGENNHNTDASITEIIAPNNSAQYIRVGTICANPTVTIQNTGEETLTSATIEYWVNDGNHKQSYEWTGSLDFLESEEVTIPSERELWFDANESGNRFYAEISKPNGGTDAYPQNNMANSSFNLPRTLPDEFEIEVKTNNRAFENSYWIFDINGDQVATNTLQVSNRIYNDSYNLGEGCYKLEFRDTGNDGITWWANPDQGSGYIRIIDPRNNNVIENFEQDFGGGFEYPFTVGFTLSHDELEFVKSINIYPNPSTETSRIEFDNTGLTELEVFDILGAKLAQNRLTYGENYIDVKLSGLSNGIYLVRIKKDGMLISRQIVKQ